jgi:hypothetical protein
MAGTNDLRIPDPADNTDLTWPTAFERMIPPDVVDYCEDEEAEIYAALVPPSRTYTEEELVRAAYFVSTTGKPVLGAVALVAGRAMLILPTGSSAPVRPFVELGIFTAMLEGDDES